MIETCNAEYLWAERMMIWVALTKPLQGVEGLDSQTQIPDSTMTMIQRFPKERCPVLDFAHDEITVSVG